jgi:hypothetical protein
LRCNRVFIAIICEPDHAITHQTWVFYNHQPDGPAKEKKMTNQENFAVALLAGLFGSARLMEDGSVAALDEDGNVLVSIPSAAHAEWASQAAQEAAK